MLYFNSDVVLLITTLIPIIIHCCACVVTWLCASFILHRFTFYLKSTNLTLFVETKWEEWWESFSHDGLRGKVFTILACLLSSSN